MKPLSQRSTRSVIPDLRAGPRPASAIAGVPLTLGAVNVNLVDTATRYTERLNQFDLRFSKSIRVLQGRFQGIVEIFNATNTDTILAQNLTYGRGSGRRVLAGRLFTLGTQTSQGALPLP